MQSDARIQTDQCAGDLVLMLVRWSVSSLLVCSLITVIIRTVAITDIHGLSERGRKGGREKCLHFEPCEPWTFKLPVYGLASCLIWVVLTKSFGGTLCSWVVHNEHGHFDIRSHQNENSFIVLFKSVLEVSYLRESVYHGEHLLLRWKCYRKCI